MLELAQSNNDAMQDSKKIKFIRVERTTSPRSPLCPLFRFEQSLLECVSTVQ